MVQLENKVGEDGFLNSGREPLDRFFFLSPSDLGRCRKNDFHTPETIKVFFFAKVLELSDCLAESESKYAEADMELREVAGTVLQNAPSVRANTAARTILRSF